MAKKTGVMPLHGWLRQDAVLGHIINSYAGLEQVRNGGKFRRIFIWEAEEGTVKGNIDAFLIHLGEKFERKLSKWDSSELHNLLRELGEEICTHTHRHSPQEDSPRIGRFKQPEPEQWVIRPKG